MKMSQQEFEVLANDHHGFCSNCNDLSREDVEPDAYEYECEKCGSNSVMGLELALLEGHINLKLKREKVDNHFLNQQED